jgi:hypothetical protein
MYINIIESYRNVIAICDKELLGQKFFEGEKQLYIKESFYLGEEKTPEEIKEMILEWSGEDATFNIVGEESVQTALETGIITEEGIGKIDNIPYALVLL